MLVVWIGADRCSCRQVFALLTAGEAHRHVGRTNYNEVSSRSHTIFRILVESSPRSEHDGDDAGGKVRFSGLNLVDLAGSENADKAGAARQHVRLLLLHRLLCCAIVADCLHLV